VQPSSSVGTRAGRGPLTRHQKVGAVYRGKPQGVCNSNDTHRAPRTTGMDSAPSHAHWREGPDTHVDRHRFTAVNQLPTTPCGLRRHAESVGLRPQQRRLCTLTITMMSAFPEPTSLPSDKTQLTITVYRGKRDPVRARREALTTRHWGAAASYFTAVRSHLGRHEGSSPPLAPAGRSWFTAVNHKRSSAVDASRPPGSVYRGKQVLLRRCGHPFTSRFGR
jgi:hypothetical protein